MLRNSVDPISHPLRSVSTLVLDILNTNCASNCIICVYMTCFFAEYHHEYQRRIWHFCLLLCASFVSQSSMDQYHHIHVFILNFFIFTKRACCSCHTDSNMWLCCLVLFPFFLFFCF